MTTVEIRPALTTDLPDIQNCALEAYAKYVERMDREPAPMSAEFGIQITNGYVDVATLGSQFAGYVVFYPKGDHLHLESVAVRPECSGQGVGKRLIEHVEHHALNAGYKAVELYTNEVMTENLAMYTRMGYIEVDRRLEAGFNRVFFRKPI
ncbi:GNAT family N-acetyltransferase [Saccharospirillum salsuginis]|uniref:Acetyltransferase n=1 Tax=Saccharospirillum salsuginis TaxID=418750 RepID=A0A918K0T5_9GAMM|nr:GNAT family N-acetyltransferase [Saccharospirillum salsuginis]GGX40095.1 acetyltransferase [Saccharospirillum salsuginis]